MNLLLKSACYHNVIQIGLGLLTLFTDAHYTESFFSISFFVFLLFLTNC